MRRTYKHDDLVAHYAGAQKLCNCQSALERHCREFACSAGQMETADWVARKVARDLGLRVPRRPRSEVQRMGMTWVVCDGEGK